MKRPAMLAALPRLRWRPGPRYPLVNSEVRNKAPALAADFETLDAELLPNFYELDEKAMHTQNGYRLSRLLIILGGAAATALGAAQAAAGAGIWEIGLAEAAVSGSVAAGVTWIRIRGRQQEWYKNRLAAEKLRGEYFLFLSRIAPYDGDDAARLDELQARLLEARRQVS